MAFAPSIIGPDERLIMICRLHWIYLAQGIAWLILWSVIGFGLDHMLWTYFGNYIPFYNREFMGYFINYWSSPIKWMFVAAGLVFVSSYFLKLISSEVALTSKRLIYKTGFLFVDLQEIELEEVKGEKVHHGILGWLLGYGRIEFDCRFIGDVFLPAIANPYRLMKAVHRARSKLTDSIAFAFPMPVGPQSVHVPMHGQWEHSVHQTASDSTITVSKSKVANQK